MEKLITKSFKRLLDKGIHRGFITHEELGKSLGKRHFSQENLESAFLHIFDNKITLVEKKSDYSAIKKRETLSSDSQKSKDVEKSDDPIRMYLREMGGVELLSREGEIAIAKRIVAGKDYMINGLFQSPLSARKVFEWKEKLEKNEIMVREIIDIDSSYIDAENEEQSLNFKKGKTDEKKKNDKSKKSAEKTGAEENVEESSKDNNQETDNEEDEFNPTLAAMEEEVKPQVISTINALCKDYIKLIKIQNDKLNHSLNGQDFSRAKEKNYAKLQEVIIKKIKTLQLNASVLESLLETHYQENKKITSLEGILLRLVVENKIPREEFLKYYIGNEINPKFESFLTGNASWKAFFKKHKKDFHEITSLLCLLFQDYHQIASCPKPLEPLTQCKIFPTGDKNETFSAMDLINHGERVRWARENIPRSSLNSNEPFVWVPHQTYNQIKHLFEGKWLPNQAVREAKIQQSFHGQPTPFRGPSALALFRKEFTKLITLALILV